MSLNKRTGLYSMPSHHVHGVKSAPRPSFNSMDFVPEEAKLPSTAEAGVQQVKDSASETTPQTGQEKKTKKKRSMSVGAKQQADSHTPVAATPLIKVTPATGSTAGKKDKIAARSDKKRKRKSEGHIDLASMLPKCSSTGGFVVGADMLQNVQSSVKAAGCAFSSMDAKANVGELPSKKKSKKTKASRKSNDTIDFDRMAKETCSIDKKARREQKAKRRSAEAARSHAPVTVPASSSSPIVSSLPPPRKTPVPIPQSAFPHTVTTSKADRVDRRDSRLVLLDTPPSQLPKTPVNLPDSPIPFKLTDAAKAKEHKSSKQLGDPSPRTPVVVEPPSPTPPALNKNHRLAEEADDRISLTTSNLMKYMTTTQPLSDGPKSRPKPLSRAASTAGSSTSGGTTPSIKDLFARVGKPYSRSGAEVDPFIAAEPKKKVILETHEELNATEFTTRYLLTQRAVNFSDERYYLDIATAWRTSNTALGPLPCLGQKASGCNSKRETILRLTRDDPTSHVKVQAADEADAATLALAKERGAAAESFLAMSIAARVPIALGVVEGEWKLFCPGYSEEHIDKYGYGQRTLRIFSVPPSASSSSSSFSREHNNTDESGNKEEQEEKLYTARLSIPPRSMLYQLRPFSAPPHASFRSTVLKTCVEGYKMDIVFLGNGYLLLRVDLRLLLSGKEGEGGSRVMEFLGVHVGAVRWREEVDELEEVGRKLFAKYDGEA